MSDEETSFARSLAVVQEISLCRRKFIASAIKSMVMAASGAVTSIAVLFLSDLLLHISIMMTTFGILLMMLTTGYLISIAAKKTFKYTLDTRVIGDEALSLDLFVTTIALLLILFVYNVVNAPQLVLAAPFLMVSLAKIIHYRKSKLEHELVSGVSLLSLTLISLTLPLPRALAAEPASYTVSAILEAISILSEAEECGSGKEHIEGNS